MSTSGLSGRAAPQARPFVSVIVPVFDNPAGLERCLRALDAQTYPTSRYEVLVVDNGSRRSPATIVVAHQRTRLIVESRPGSYSARNAGIRLARGEVLAFTDADCVPDQAWVERGVLALEQDPSRGLIGGQVSVPLRDPARPTALELFTMVNSRRQWVYVARDRFAETSNLFTRRRVLDQLGPFDERLRSCGDVVWGRRVFMAGWQLHYAEWARVEHPALGSIGALARRYARLVGGKYDISRHYGPALAVTRTSPIDRGQFVASLRRTWLDDRIHRRSDRLKVSAILVLLQFVALFERGRLRLGGRPLR